MSSDEPLTTVHGLDPSELILLIDGVQLEAWVVALAKAVGSYGAELRRQGIDIEVIEAMTQALNTGLITGKFALAHNGSISWFAPHKKKL